ncbi:MAG: SpoIIE family protein phosphatase [Gammaproteobacteria bacterium]|nr:SpoIIE family protein phosphatase [Gammaproteobacteria bacterium]NIR85460.1 SpoIIE family protein phosphatase [Gammaproteobacteria bacterium]NIR89512.1 SpoIIE family protein phosphatase [Gammaproteobacteria bacterium]NIU06597.1 SpoIIE family protein phosphatase [Gammaproteobacteria bacterium]NIV53480.1 SpoIIE family protein phosphatase [Gammaproteobacteria bacterium]
MQEVEGHTPAKSLKGAETEERWSGREQAERVFCGEERTESRIVFSAGEVVVYSARAPGKESSNEDAAAVVYIKDACTLLAVADGVGSQPSGAKAACVALEALCEVVRSSHPDADSAGTAILTAFDEANRAVMALGNRAATTLAIVEVRRREVRTYHAGDSGVLIFGGRGKVRLQTIAHSPVGYALEAGLLDESAAMEHEDRHIVSNVVGDPQLHVGVSSPVELRPRDTIVVASDGLFDNLYQDEVVEFLRRGSLRKSVRAAAEETQARMSVPVEGRPCKPDDLTLAAYRPSGRD